MFRNFMWIFLMVPALGCGQASHNENIIRSDTAEIVNLLDSTQIKPHQVTIDSIQTLNDIEISYWRRNTVSIKYRKININVDSLNLNEMDSVLAKIDTNSVDVAISLPNGNPSGDEKIYFDEFIDHLKKSGFTRFSFRLDIPPEKTN